MYLAFDIETTGLNPIEDRICCIGIKNDKICKIFFDEDEKKTLSDFWDYLRKLKNDEDVCLVGYNSVKFDSWFLLVRSLKHNVRIVPFKKKEEHIDLMFALTTFGNARKLSDFIKLIGLEDECKDDFTGSDVPKLWEQEAYQVIIEHNMTDIKKTWELFQRALKLGMISRSMAYEL